ncbi:MAG: hypothetical protein QM662_11705 [Gordonia sp. (in: high G+C Gram-positive bacteria)]
MKTYGTAFIDDQYRDTAGQFIVGYTIPDGYTTETVALNHWLFPELNDIDCSHTDSPPPETPPDIPEPPTTTYSPTRAKHDRRRAERARNRERRRAEREQLDRDLGPPPF